MITAFDVYWEARCLLLTEPETVRLRTETVEGTNAARLVAEVPRYALRARATMSEQALSNGDGLLAYVFARAFVEELQGAITVACGREERAWLRSIGAALTPTSARVLP